MADPSSTPWYSVEQNITILKNIAVNLLPVQRLITGAAYLIGISFAIKALFSLKVYGEARTMMSTNTSIKEPLVYVFVAAMLLYFPTSLSVMLTTTFGTSSIMQYAPVTGPGTGSINDIFNSSAGLPLTIIIQTIGVAAFVRGWILIARSASQGQPAGGGGKGLIHVFGGILAINIVQTVNIINNTIWGT